MNTPPTPPQAGHQVSARQIADLLHWARALTEAGPDADPTEHAAYQAAKADLLTAIADDHAAHTTAVAAAAAQAPAPATEDQETTMIERLQAHYGFTKTPFGRDLAPSMLHHHTAHAEAAARITWTVTEHALGVITGEVGVGKTVAVRAALTALDPARHTIIYLPNPTVGARGLHHRIVTALGGKPAHGNAALTAQASDTLANEAAERGRTPVLAIDEAHLLDHDQLEGIRMLTNHDMDSRSPFAALLIGQPTLRRRIKLGILAALDQRIAVRYHMTGMTLQETADYLRHHLALAGRSDTLFSDDAAALIQQTSRGYPRAVNNLAVQSLIAAFAAGKAIVDEKATRSAVTEVTTE